MKNCDLRHNHVYYCPIEDQLYVSLCFLTHTLFDQYPAISCYVEPNRSFSLNTLIDLGEL